MEDWLAFIETFSLYLFHDLPWPRGQEWAEVGREFKLQWDLLRPAMLLFLRLEEAQHSDKQIDRHGEMFLAYGERVETVCYGWA
jgi:hypothetical protein